MNESEFDCFTKPLSSYPRAVSELVLYALVNLEKEAKALLPGFQKRMSLSFPEVLVTVVALHVGLPVPTGSYPSGSQDQERLDWENDWAWCRSQGREESS